MLKNAQSNKMTQTGPQDRPDKSTDEQRRMHTNRKREGERLNL